MVAVHDEMESLDKTARALRPGAESIGHTVGRYGPERVRRHDNAQRRLRRRQLDTAAGDTDDGDCSYRRKAIMSVETRKAPNKRAGTRPGRWVRKNMLMDQRKLDVVKRELNVSTETEAVDAALDEIAFRRELVRGIRSLRQAGGLTEVFDER